MLLAITPAVLALDNQVQPTSVVMSPQGSCRASGLCCQSKNNTCRGVVDKDNEVDLEKKNYVTRCFCDTACLDIGDCCSDYVQSCQRK